MIFFEILTGEIPFENLPLRNVLQSIHDRMRPQAMFLKHPCSQEDVPLDYPEHQGALVQPRLFGSLKDVVSYYGGVEYGGELVEEMNLRSFNSSIFMLCGGSSAFEFDKR
ncbi:unnamed protein product [Sphagnum troendelagicum]|uniref:Uncharacterized protein n=1 Tax=Sphagnum troendelagicum TaxID=128251 RepID=A0ABP0TCS4_9BRYO